MVTNIEKFQKRKEASEKIDKIIIIISILMLAIIPNVMYRKDVTSYSPIITGHPYATGSQVDVFNYYKSVLVNISAFFMLILFSYKTIVLKQDIKKHILNIVVPILGFIILLSSTMSDYKSIAFFGNHDRFEGSLVWFSYLVIFFVLFNTKIDEKYYKFYYIALIPFIVINSIFSISYLYGHNLLVEQEWLNNMLGGGLSGYIITTLYNQNFGSGISAVVFSVSFMYLLLAKKLWVKIGLTFLTCLSYAMLLSMLSLGGFLTTLVTVPIIVMIGIRFRGIKNTSIFTVLILSFNLYIYKVLNTKNQKIHQESFVIFDKLEEFSDIIMPIFFGLFFVLLIALIFSNKKKVIDIFILTLAVVIGIGFISFSSVIKNNKEEFINSEIFNKLNSLSTYRLEIWTQTIDLANDSLLLGEGMDTFPYDIHKNGENNGIISYGDFMDKPHNWFLTILHGSGVFALIIIIYIVLYTVRDMFIKITEKIDSKYIYIFSVGSIAYVIQGITNDSFIGTSIFFWILTAISLNRVLNLYKDTTLDK